LKNVSSHDLSEILQQNGCGLQAQLFGFTLG